MASVSAKLRSAADEAVLRDRVVGLGGQDQRGLEGVYVYMPPWFRDRVSLEKFLGNKALYVYLSPQVEWVEAKGDQGRAKVTVATRHNDPAATKMKPQPDRFVESWIKVDGTWYLKVPPPRRLQNPQRKASSEHWSAAMNRVNGVLVWTAAAVLLVGCGSVPVQDVSPVAAEASKASGRRSISAWRLTACLRTASGRARP
ncbi:MAG: hypothetical protein IPI27_18430 [Betaproteobacteria bacterium]|nr:hypothetical protein [Betaproteobacteria bacterium]